MNLPQLLKDFRAARALTQDAAAEQLGVNLDTLQNWEAARNAPRGLALAFLLQKISPTSSAPEKRRPAQRRKSNPTTPGTRASTRGGNRK